LNIKLSTCKFIWKTFRTDGRVFTKKKQRIDKDLARELNDLRSKLFSQTKQVVKQPEQVCVPVLVPVMFEQQFAPFNPFPVMTLW
jgi:hypothetical protein